MKQAINTRTQEEYDALYVRCIEKPDEGFIRRGVTVGKIYMVEASDDIDKDYIITDDDGLRGYFLQRFFEIIPYTEFAKANIVEEPDYKALYLEGRELLEDANKELILWSRNKPLKVMRQIESYLAKHNHVD